MAGSARWILLAVVAAVLIGGYMLWRTQQNAPMPNSVAYGNGRVEGVHGPSANRPQTLDYWPTEGWRTASPESQGLDSGTLLEMLKHIEVADLDVHSLHIIRHGYLVLDATFYPYDGKTRHDVASVTKSVTSALLGAALHAGKLESLDQSLVETLNLDAKALDDPIKQNITLAHLVSMRSGLDCGLQPGEPELIAMMATSDWPAFALSLPMSDPPGARFAYCSPGMHLLSAAISAVTQQNARSFAETTLFGPLGIKPGDWPVDPRGHSHGWGDLHLHPYDMAKVGLLFLHDGRWDGAQILPADWVSRTTRSRGATGLGEDGYGYGWWVLGGDYSGLFEARGRGSQSIAVWPEQDLVVVMTGGGFDRAEVAPFLVRSIKATGPLPENDRITDRLKAALAAARAGPEPRRVSPAPPLAAIVSGRIHNLSPNPLGFETIRFEFAGDDAAVLNFEMSTAIASSAAGHFEMAIGLDGRYRFTPDGPGGHVVGLHGAWTGENSFEMHYAEPAGPNAFDILVRFNGDQVRLSVSDATGLYGQHEITGKALPL